MQADKSGKKIVLTGGGTAGHVTPNIALLPRLRDEGFTEIHYIGSGGIEKDIVAKEDGVIYHEIPSGKLRRYFSLKNLTDPFRVIGGIIKAKKIMKEIRPDVVFSKGGFVSVPVVIAAKGISPVVAHESDYTPGLATRISAMYADRICVSFEDTVQYLPKGKTVHTGSPVRAELLSGDAQKGRDIIGATDDKPVLMVMGGSLGAAALNKAVREALPDLLDVFNIAHICGTGKTDDSCAGIRGYKQFEYVSDDLPHIFAAADIIVSRAGANSIFEFLALGIPSVLIPLPSKSSRGDQILNAGYFEKKGFSLTMSQDKVTPQTLTQMIMKLYMERGSFIRTMQSEKGAADGANNVVDVIVNTIR